MVGGLVAEVVVLTALPVWGVPLASTPAVGTAVRHSAQR